MSTTKEIETKEQQLTELMHRVLREPIAPLSDKMNELQVQIFEIQKKCKEIDCSIDGNSDQIEKASKVITRKVSNAIEEITNENNEKISNISEQLDKTKIYLTESILQLKIENDKSLALIHSKIVELEEMSNLLKLELRQSAENTFTKTNDALQMNILNATKQVNDLQCDNLNQLLNALMEQNQGLQASIKQSQQQFDSFKKLSLGFFVITLAFITYEIAAIFFAN